MNETHDNTYQMDKELKGEVSPAEAKAAISGLKIFTSDEIWAIRDHRNRQETNCYSSSGS